ncbi:MAG: hypothetical protein KAX49_13660 [Halanaerobiales bacterium]|nr:hypothetical protein [Halanaerobiales bacterium]
MAIWKQTSLFVYTENQTLENIVPSIRIFGEPTPYALVQRGIEKFTNTGDIILDCCCGSGTTGIAALKMNRKAILSDLNQLAILTSKSLFSFFDYNRVNFLWRQIREGSVEGEMKAVKGWDAFLKNPIPLIPSFKRISNRHIQNISELYDEEDLKILKSIYSGILEIQDQSSRIFLEVIFYNILIESSQLAISRNGRSFYLPKRQQNKDPIDLFQKKFDLFLRYKSLIREQLARNFSWTPKIIVSSARNLDYLEEESVDYVSIHLPDINGYREGDMSYLGELLFGDVTNYEEEITLELDYKGRYRLIVDLTKLFKEIERVLKEKGYLTLIFAGHHALFSLIVKVAQNEGWNIIQEEVEIMNGILKNQYPLISLTLQKQKQHTVLGALNKMKFETLYDTEEAILRKIDQYLTQFKTATTEKIQKYLIENYLHDCLIEKPLESLLEENYLWSGKYWIKPSSEQREKLFQLRRKMIKKDFHKFVSEMVYHFLNSEKRQISYNDLIKRFMKLKPRQIFHTPYYRLYMEQCEKREIKLYQLIQEFFEEEKKDTFDSLSKVLKRILKEESPFSEILKGESIGLSEWTADDFFKIYLDLYEKAKKTKNVNHAREFGEKVLNLLEQVKYLDNRKREKIRDYIKRSER